MLAIIAGHDPQDATSVDAPVPDYRAALTGDLRGLRVGVPRHLLATGVEPDIAAAFDRALDELEHAGAKLNDVTLPHADLAIAVYYLIGNAEASSNLARYDGVRYGVRAEAATTHDM